MPVTQQKTWRAGRFWWDCSSPAGTGLSTLRALIFDLDALADVECEGHRLAYNAAFAAHGLSFQWSVTRYRQLLALTDERARVSAELRKRGVSTESDVLTQLLADDIYTTKSMMLDEMILDADLAPRPGLIDLVMDAFTSGVDVGVVTGGQRSWAEPLVRQLVGDGVVATVVTADDVKKPMPDPEAFRTALWELGIPAEHALAITGSASGLRAATSTGLATVVITGDGAPSIPAALAVRPDYAGDEPLRITDCQRLHRRWTAARKPAHAA
ncbi:haloacid dehalogenase [Mycolicibacterium agri]|uniref:Haloacid dehalogenase n=1 Tax=Mycolicibacterium agri TaxID=36811 RepID=A0A2A7MYI8_MYCAG|nr:HAD-IA family hydrolase [Mycolicibacterium agri]PEG36567.1 haloacid dehalogenase [Mycolicibacterium agri]GFG52016.1 haloacid dehalogenase [Mycolicibacterium agri]